MIKKIICFDLDNVICKTNKNFYKKSKPNKKVISMINNLYIENYYIKIFTARFMGQLKGNKKKSKRNWIYFYKNSAQKMGC